ncbi:MAG: hypothetical protein ACREKE_09480, partial [bacterium]
MDTTADHSTDITSEHPQSPDMPGDQTSATADMTTDLITIEDLALQAGVSTRHARRWAQQNRFPTRQIVVDKHLRLMVPREIAERFLRQRQAELAESADETTVTATDNGPGNTQSADKTAANAPGSIQSVDSSQDPAADIQAGSSTAGAVSP